MLLQWKKFFKILTILFFLLIINGCAVFYAKPVPSGEHLLTWKERLSELKAFNDWYNEGVFGVTVNGKTNIANFDWQQHYNNYVINIFTTLHVGSAKIEGDNTKVIFWKSAKEKIIAKTPEELLYKQFGWSLPISDLIYWVKGMPAPLNGITKKHFDAFNHLIMLQQQGWKIAYHDFISVGAVDVPSKIYLENPKFKIKIIIKHWNA